MRNVRKRRRKLKEIAVEYKGGKCILCGYDKCIVSLSFHHRDPEKKEFVVGHRCTSFEKAKPEVDKCDLLCRNCHGEFHFNEFVRKRKINLVGMYA